MYKVVLFVLHFLSTLNKKFLHEGDPCQLNNSSIGQCRNSTVCPSYMSYVRNNNVNIFAIEKAYGTCGYSGFLTKMVCCPEISQPPVKVIQISSPRRAALECASYPSLIPPNLGPTILNGTNTAPGEFPHMVALGYYIPSSGTNDYQCGGSLISNRYVITAAHCNRNREGIEPTFVKLGTHLLNDTRAQIAGIEVIITHPNYTAALFYNDISLIRLNMTIEYLGYLYPACLNTEEIPTNALVTATGWGDISLRTSQRSNILLKIDLTIAGMDECKAAHNSSFNLLRIPNGIVDSQICAIDRSPVRGDTCQGDSGGPLQFRIPRMNTMYSVVGIVSFGEPCGSALPSVYTKISSFLDWIESVVWPN